MPYTIGQKLVRVCRAHYNLAGQLFSQMDTGRGQPPVLFELDREDGITQSELAGRMEFTQATLTNMLRRLEAAGLIFRQRDPVDGRASRVYLTSHGKDTLSQAREISNRIDEITFAGFSPEELAMMDSFLERIHTNLTR